MIVPLDLADPQQAETLHRIWLAAYAQEAALLGLAPAHFPPLQQTAADLQARGWQFFGAMAGNTLAGAAALGEENDGALRLNALVVWPNCQRRGLGRQLVAEACGARHPGACCARAPAQPTGRHWRFTKRWAFRSRPGSPWVRHRSKSCD